MQRWITSWPGSPAPERHRRRRAGALACALAVLLAAPPAAAAGEERHPVTDELRDRLEDAVERSGSFENRFAAQVWLMDMSQRLEDRMPDHGQRLELLRLVHAEATRADLSPELVLAVIEVESNFDRFAISPVGARGLMQIMPFWLDEIGREDDNLFHMDTNLRFGTTIPRHYLDKENGNLTRALARYNGSLGQTWYPERVFRALRQRWETY